jgi:hypothetical protein
MIIDIRFKQDPPVQIQNVRRVSVYPHPDEHNHESEAILIVYYNDNSKSSEHFILDTVDNFWLTND